MDFCSFSITTRSDVGEYINLKRSVKDRIRRQLVTPQTITYQGSYLLFRPFLNLQESPQEGSGLITGRISGSS